MDSFKELLNHYIIAEAISLKNAKKKMLSKKYSGAYNDRLDEIFKGKNRIFRNLKIDYSNIDSPLKRKIENFLIQKKYQIDSMEDYIKGIAYKYKIVDEISFATEVDRKNPLKIGKLLQKFEEDGEIEVTHRVDGKKTTKTVTGKPLLHEFKNDPIRSSNGDFVIVISRHPYDIAGASTDRSWTSCMDLGLERINYPKTAQKAGINKKYIPQDIDEGTLVAYVVTEDEMYIANGEPKCKLQKPLSRILMKPHNSDVGKVYTVGTRYGSNYPEFYQHIKEWVSINLNRKLTGGERVYKNPKLYNDGDTPVDFEFNTGSEITDEVVSELLNQNNEKELGNQITFDTTNNGHVVNVELKITIDFGKDIVKPFEYLNDIYSSSDNIPSEYEKLVAHGIFSHLKGNMGRNFNDGSPRVTVNSLGDGIEIEIDANIQIHGYEDKYEPDEDYIYDTIKYSLPWLQNIDYKVLRYNLYKICSTYDWQAYDTKKINDINEALELYKSALNSFTTWNSSANIHLQSLEVITPLKVVEWENLAIGGLFYDLRSTVNAFERIYRFIIMAGDNNTYYFKRDERYTDAKFKIFYEWFKRTFNVDLVNYKNETKRLWKITDVFELVRKLRESGEPSNIEKSELLLDIREEQGKVINHIEKCIGYMGEIKI